jgi:hypothetical protein
MRNLLILTTLTVPAAVLSAPRPAPEIYFETADAEAYSILIGPQNVGDMEMKVSYAVRGKVGATYTVELYVEVDNTGEKAELLRSAPIRIPDKGDKGQVAKGQFKVRCRLAADPESPKEPYLPYATSERLWSYRLVLREGDEVVATSGPGFVPVVRRHVRVPEGGPGAAGSEEPVPSQKSRDPRRTPPAVIEWTGAASSAWENEFNWSMQAAPTAADTAVLAGTRPNAPVIAAGQEVLIDSIHLLDAATFGLTIDGTLIARGSLIRPKVPYGFVGSGTLRLGNAAAAVDHVWHSGYVKVKTVEVQDGGVLEVGSECGQLGPDAGSQGDSTWVVGAKAGGVATAGTLLLKGDHLIGFNELRIGNQGEVKYHVGGTLMYVPPASPQKAWRPFAIINANKFEIAEGQAVLLTGGYYEQVKAAAAEPTATFRPGSSLAFGRFEGSTGAPAYAFDVRSGKVVAFEKSAEIQPAVRATTDIRIKDATLEFHNPGTFRRVGVSEQMSELLLTARDGMTAKTVLIENTPVKFLDWDPPGRYTASTQVNARLSVDGILELKGTPELHLRVNIGGLSSDEVLVLNPAGQTKLAGNSTKLKLHLKNLADRTGEFAIPMLLAGPSLEVPTTPFGGGTWLVNPPAGWWSGPATIDGNKIRVVINKKR